MTSTPNTHDHQSARTAIAAAFLNNPSEHAWQELLSAILNQHSAEAEAESASLYVVLNDGETFSAASGACLVKVDNDVSAAAAKDDALDELIEITADGSTETGTTRVVIFPG